MTSDFITKITKVKTALEAIFVKKADRSHISYGQVDSTSTSTAFTATVTGLTSLIDGATVMLRNGYITSAEGFTLDVNGLGAKPVYNSMANATRDTTIFNINYTMLFVYDSTRIEGGCWICYRGYNSDKDTNTIGYQIRTNSSTYTATDKFVRYRLLLEVDNGHYMPVNTSTSTSGTASKSSAMNTREFKIGGRIMYYGTTAAVSANTQIAGITYLWRQINLVLGYSFSNSSSGPSLTTGEPVYMIAKPSTTNKGMAKLNTPYYTQSLPSTADGLIYIYLGQATDATHVELVLDHPIYEYHGSSIRLYREYYDSDEVDTLLSGKSDIGHTHSYAASSHTHTKNEISDFPTSMTPTSHAHGNLQNDGSVSVSGTVQKSKNLVTDANGYITAEAKPTIPSASSTTPSADTANGSIGSGTTWAKADHTHPKSSIYAESSHTHSEYVNPTIVDNLTTNDATKVLSAKQGKVLQDNKLEKTHSSYKGKNVVTNASTGAIEFENKYSHPSTHASSMITDSNTYNNIGNTANTLDNILSNINSKLGTLTTIDLVEVTTNKGTASASTMNKLYLVAESSSATNDNYEIFVTVRTGTSGNYSYAWEKIDTARIDLNGYLTTSNASSTYLSKTDASSTYVAKETGKGLFSGSYSDLTNKPSYSATVTNSTTDSVKIGSININGSNVDIYATNTVYTHPTELSSALTTSSLYKIKANTKGHITEATSIGIDTTSGGTESSTDLITSDAVYMGLYGKADIGHNHTSSDIADLSIPTDVSNLTDTNNTAFTPKSHTHGNLQNNGQVGLSATNNGIVLTDNTGKITASTSIAKQTIGLGTSSNASKNVVTDANGKLTTEDKYSHPTPTNLGGAKTSGLYKVAVDAQGHITETASVGASDLPSHTHSYATSNDISSSISTHNSSSSAHSTEMAKKLDISQTSYKGKNVVVDSTSGNISFEDKYSHPTNLSNPLSTKSLYQIKADTGGHITEASSIGLVTSFNSTTSDEKVPSEKLVKNSLDNKSDNGHEHTSIYGESGLPIVRDDIQEEKLYGLGDRLIFEYGLSNTLYYDRDGYGSEAYNEVATIGDLPYVPSPSSSIPSADTASGSYGSGASYARSNHSHPKSNLYVAKTEDYHYNMTFSTTNPTIGNSVTVTITVTNGNNDAVADHSFTLNRPSGTSNLTTDSDGVATYTYTPSSWGIHTFSVGDVARVIRVGGSRSITSNNFTIYEYEDYVVLYASRNYALTNSSSWQQSLGINSTVTPLNNVYTATSHKSVLARATSSGNVELLNTSGSAISSTSIQFQLMWRK